MLFSLPIKFSWEKERERERESAKTRRLQSREEKKELDFEGINDKYETVKKTSLIFLKRENFR